MKQTIEYKPTETLNDDRAITDPEYSNAKYEEANIFIKKMNCMKLDVLAKKIGHFFNDPVFLKTDDPVITFVDLNETEQGKPYWEEVRIINEQGKSFELKTYDGKFFFDRILNELSDIINTYALIEIQNEQGFLFKVNNNSVYQDVQSTMDKVINMVEPSYVINKQNHMLQEQTTIFKQVKQKSHL